MNGIFQSKYFKFGIVAVLYILWVIWMGNFWWLFGLPVVYDVYVSKMVNWAFWKKRSGKNNVVIEWLDALIFAVIAVTLINIFLFQNYRIPTPSMEKSLLVGDHLAVSKVLTDHVCQILLLLFRLHKIQCLSRTEEANHGQT